MEDAAALWPGSTALPCQAGSLSQLNRAPVWTHGTAPATAAGLPPPRDKQQPCLEQEPFLTFAGKTAVLEVSVTADGLLCCLYPVYSLISRAQGSGSEAAWLCSGSRRDLLSPVWCPAPAARADTPGAPQLLGHHKLPKQSAKAPFDG